MKRALFGLLWMSACVVPPQDQVKFGEEVDDTDNDTTPETDVPDAVDTGEAPAGELYITLVDAPEQVEVGDARTPIYVRVQGASDLATVTFVATSDVDGAIDPPVYDPVNGGFVWSTAGLSAGWHVLTLEVTDAVGATGSATWTLGVCAWPEVEPFDTSVVGNGWTRFGDATWDPGGWLEITGNQPSRAGSIYKNDRKVNPGDFRMEFDIRTGNGINSGADGYSVNIINVVDEAALAEVVAHASNGGCLGYGTVTGCGNWQPISAFHVEFDTWYNNEAPMFDPTSENHVAINLDGNPGGHPLWAPVPSLEDFTWRHIIVQIQSNHIVVGIDGARVIDDVIPNFTFDGGYIGVSGSTGWATNNHQFDNLLIHDRCVVPDPATP